MDPVYLFLSIERIAISTPAIPSPPRRPLAINPIFFWDFSSPLSFG